MGIDDAAQAAKDRLDMVGREDAVTVEFDAGGIELEVTVSGPDKAVAKKILWEIWQLAMDAAELGDPHDKDLEPLVKKAVQAIGHAIKGT